MFARKLCAWMGALVIVGAGAAAVAADDTAYEIKFERPQKVGQTFTLAQSVELTQTMVEQNGGKEKKATQHAKVMLEGTQEVLAVDDHGRQSKFRLVITRLEASQGGAPLETMIKADVEVTGTYSDNKIDFALSPSSKGELSKPAAEALGAFLPPHSADMKITSDDLLGTKEKKKVGESWSMNVKLLGPAMGLSPETAVGTMKLEAVFVEHGAKWLRYSQSLEGPTLVNDTALGKSKEGRMTARGTDSHPMDVANPSDKSEGSRNLHAVFEQVQKDGTTSTITVDRNEARTSSVILTGMAATAPATMPKK
jgi:hypothetical protein